MAAAPETVRRLVDRFDQDRKVFLSGDYKEEQIRAECGQRTCRLRFLNPFFESLGWDMDNKQGRTGRRSARLPWDAGRRP